jgi:hypothetical protein
MQQSKVFVKNEKINKDARQEMKRAQVKAKHSGKQWERNDNKRQQYE